MGVDVRVLCPQLVSRDVGGVVVTPNRQRSVAGLPVVEIPSDVAVISSGPPVSLHRLP